MPKPHLDDQIARLTGEDRRTIRRLGFSPLQPMPLQQHTDGDNRKPLVVDWDELELERTLAMSG